MSRLKGTLSPLGGPAPKNLREIDADGFSDFLMQAFEDSTGRNPKWQAG